MTPLSTLTVARLLATGHRPVLRGDTDLRVNPPPAGYVNRGILYLVAAALSEAIPATRWEIDLHTGSVYAEVATDEVAKALKALMADWYAASRAVAEAS